MYIHITAYKSGQDVWLMCCHGFTCLTQAKTCTCTCTETKPNRKNDKQGSHSN